MMNYKTVTILTGLFLFVLFLASSVVAAEKDGLMMKEGKLMRMHDGKEVSRMDRETTLSNGTKIMMSGTMKMKDGNVMQLQEGQTVMLDGTMKEDGKDMKMGTIEK